MRQHRLILYTFFLLAINQLNAQSISISGFIREEGSREPLVGANIWIVEQNKGTPSNSDGFYTFFTSPGKITLIASYIGYSNDTIQFKSAKDTIIDISLKSTLTLSEVTIRGEQRTDAKDQLGVINLSIKQIEQVPALLGETDPMRVLALTPGVQAGAEGSTGLYVRGGSPDQNLLLLDGTVVYNAAHLFGFLSVFNADAIKNIQLIRDGFPARYGGRLSSIVDVTMKDGNKKEHQKKLSIGLIGSRFFAEGPIGKKNLTSYMGAFRASYLSILSLPAYLQYRSGIRKDFQSLWMYDLNAKLTHEFSPKTKLALSIFNAQDYWGSFFDAKSEKSAFSLSWGNRTAALRFTQQSGKNKFIQSVLSYNAYNYKVDNSVLNDQNIQLSRVLNQAKIEDFAWQSSLQWKVNNNMDFNIGYEFRRQQINPNFTTYVGETTVSMLPESTQKINSLAAFIGQRYSTQSGIFIESGIRYSLYTLPQRNAHFIEPRIKIGVEWDSKNQSIQLSATRMSQPLHLLATSGSGLPNDIWVAADDKFGPESSNQFSFGYSWQNPTHSLKITLESYYKTMNNLIDYRPGINLYEVSGQKWEELIDGPGNGRSYGIEFSIHKNTERLSSWLAYALSKTERRIPGINNNNWYPFRYDRRHDLALTISYKLNEKWRIGSNFEFQTGSAITLPIAAQLGPDNYPIFVFAGRNNARMPNYHRLDLSFTKNKETKRKRVASWTYGVYNAYGRLNPYYVDYRLSIDSTVNPNNIFEPGKEIGIKSYFWQRTLFRFVPFISYQINY